MTAPRRRRWLWWVTGAAVVVVVLAVGGPFAYIHWPPRTTVNWNSC